MKCTLKYKRNDRDSILRIIIGLILISSVLPAEQYVLSFHFILILISSLLCIVGFWGLITPIACLTENELVFRIFIFKAYRFDLTNLRIELDEISDLFQISDEKNTYLIKKSLIKSYDRERFTDDLNSFVKEQDYKKATAIIP